jgi:hypothetical protein
MTDAYIETTVLTDVLLKPGSPKNKRAKTALQRYQNTLLPVYSIKEWKSGPLNTYAYLHDKFRFTKSYSKTVNAVSALGGMSYLKSTQMEAIAAAAAVLKSRPEIYSGLGAGDIEMADCCRLALASIIMKGWRKRRKITTFVADDLPCYIESAPRIDKDGFFDLSPNECNGDQECSLAEQLKSKPAVLTALRNAIPDSVRREDQRRRKALKQIIKHPNAIVDRETCRDLGDAIFAFFCPKTAVILTTNIKDHKPLAQSIGKDAENP